MGVPRADGYWGKCNSKEKKNYRTRCSGLISFNNKNILIDTSPDLRSQLIKEKISFIDAVIYSHLHADQTHGINELRVFYLRNKKKLMYMQTPIQKNIFKVIFLIVLRKYMVIHQF